VVDVSDVFLGMPDINRLVIIAQNPATVNEEERMSLARGGNCASASGTIMAPKPKPIDVDIIRLFRRSIGSVVSIFTPATAMVANIISVAPPNTAFGISNIKAPATGNNPSNTKNPLT
jgi:hypothetical protein